MGEQILTMCENSHDKIIRMMLMCTVTFVGLSLMGCATPLVKKLEEIRVGMDKADVLEKVGNPKRVRRVGGRDEWVYVVKTQEADEEYRFYFEAGRLVERLSPSNIQILELELEEATKPKNSP